MVFKNFLRRNFSDFMYYMAGQLSTLIMTEKIYRSIVSLASLAWGGSSIVGNRAATV